MAYQDNVDAGNQVGTDLTNLEFNPDVAIGYDGNVVITWTETADPNYLLDQGAAVRPLRPCFQSAIRLRCGPG